MKKLFVYLVISFLFFLQLNSFAQTRMGMKTKVKALSVDEVITSGQTYVGKSITVSGQATIYTPGAEEWVLDLVGKKQNSELQVFVKVTDEVKKYRLEYYNANLTVSGILEKDNLNNYSLKADKIDFANIEAKFRMFNRMHALVSIDDLEKKSSELIGKKVRLEASAVKLDPTYVKDNNKFYYSLTVKDKDNKLYSIYIPSYDLREILRKEELLKTTDSMIFYGKIDKVKDKYYFIADHAVMAGGEADAAPPAGGEGKSKSDKMQELKDKIRQQHMKDKK